MKLRTKEGLNALVRRLLAALAVFVTLVVVGSSLYFLLGHGRWHYGECVYMTITTITTVGFAELPHMADVPGGRPLTVALIVSGVGVLAYTQSTLTALLVEGTIGQALRRNRMRKQIQGLSRHIVLAGAGATGKHVIEELLATQTPFVVIDRSKEHLEHVSRVLAGGKLLYVHGDATEDHVL